jgi:tetratricopeptide (TPR) repeat protein
MFRLVAIALFVVPGPTPGQTSAPLSITFDQKVSQCENNWFVAERHDGGNVLGFAYIDASAGFTFEHYGQLDRSNGKLVAIASELQGKSRLIQRIEHDFAADCLDESLALDLGLPSEPESMQFYKDDRPAGEHHASWANHYNHIGASEAALEHVASAIAVGHSSPSLSFEHAFALNATGRFDETVALLTSIVTSRDCPADTVAELAYAHLMQDEYALAIALYERAVKVRGEKASSRRGEFAQNIAVAYTKLGNKAKRDKWHRISDRYKAREE